MIFLYSFSLFNPTSVLCRKAPLVPEVNENPNPRKIDPRTKKGNELPKTNSKVDINIDIFAMTNVFLCPNISEIYPEGISRRNPASQPIPVYNPICWAVVFGRDRK